MTDSPSLFVGSYAKYNNGNLFGAWLNLEDYTDRDDFLAACHELHKDESDLELMYPDFQCFPRRFYSESYVNPAIWDWLELSEDDRELLEVYLDNVNQDGTIGEARERFQGEYDSEEAWAEDFLEEMGYLEQVPDELRYHINFESYARDQGIDSFVFIEHEGKTWVFTRS